MKAWVLTKYGKAEDAFSLQDMPEAAPKEGEVTIDVEAFGLNYADIMARRGMYRDAPPKPCVIGYEVCGRVQAVGPGVQDLQVGQRVAAFTRFGGYSQRVNTQADGTVPIPEDMPAGIALALTVQYVTAWFCAEDRVTLMEGDHVLIQAAAGGVGTALVQLCKRKGCYIYGTAGSPEKLKYLKEQGVDVPINYRKEDFYQKIKSLRGDKGIDVAFDSLGGKAFKKQTKLLGAGGRIVGFGAASRSNGGRSIIADIRMLLGFGFYSPPFMLMESKAILGVNMLRIADHRPALLKHCLTEVVKLAAEGAVQPVVGGEFSADQLVEAHKFVEERKSMGKVFVKW